MQREQKHQAVEFLIADYALLASSLLQAMTGPTDCLVRCVFLRLFRFLVVSWPGSLPLAGGYGDRPWAVAGWCGSAAGRQVR
jgi:hypothetical protein